MPGSGRRVDDQFQRRVVIGLEAQAAPGPFDCVLDILPPAANTVQVRTAIMALRPYGRVVLMGGVGGPFRMTVIQPW
jgi:alcohol dehydrogenase